MESRGKCTKKKKKKKLGRRRCVEREKTGCPLAAGGNIDTCVFIGSERKGKQGDDRANQIRHSAIRLPVMPRPRVYGNSRTGNFICSCHHLSLPSNYSFRNTSRRPDEHRRLFEVLLPSGRASSWGMRLNERRRVEFAFSRPKLRILEAAVWWLYWIRAHIHLHRRLSRLGCVTSGAAVFGRRSLATLLCF